MFKNKVPIILSHISVLDNGNYVLPDYILNKYFYEVRLFRKNCPHRMYPLHEIGDHVENIKCKLHGFEFDNSGKAINDHPYKLNCQSYNLGKSGIVFKNFIEPDHEWVDCIANEKELEYSHSYTGESNGSWLWLTEIEADLLHVWKDGIHPWLYTQYDPYKVELQNGENWIFQKQQTGFWVYVFPYIFIEWTPGCLSLNCIFPKDNSEWGYNWMTQIYFDPKVSNEEREIFNKIEEVFVEDFELP